MPRSYSQSFRRWLAVALASFGLLGSVSEAAGVTYHVAPTGHDANAGTASSPWKSIQRAANTLAPGDTVVISPGVYRESVGITRSGAAGAYITYQAMPGAVLESPIADYSLKALDIAPGVAYIRFVGFEVRGGYFQAAFIREGTHHIEILDCHLHHNRSGVGWLGSSHGLVERCRIHDNLLGGMGFRVGAHDIVVRDTASYNHNDGLGCDGDADGFSADETAYNLTFERAEAFGNSEDGFDFKAANVVMDRSISHDNGCAGVKLWNTALLQNSLVYGNGRGVVLTSIVAGGGTVVRMVNNTVAGNANLAVGAGSTDQPFAVELFNNVVSGDNKLLDYLDCVTLTEDFNLFHRPDRLADHIVERTGCSATGSSVRFSGADIASGAWLAHGGQGARSLAADPLFVDAAQGDFSLRPASPAIDAGSATVAPVVDITGGPRPLAEGMDLGAHEADVVSVSVAAVGPGVVTSGPAGIDCGADCSGRVPPNSSVTLTAAPKVNATFVGWSHPDCAGNPCTLVVSAGVQVTATFKAVPNAPDLVVSEMVNPPATAAPGGNFGARDWVLNQGRALAPASLTRFYLSLDLARDPGDILLGGSRPVPAVPVGLTNKGSVTVTMPTGVPAGLYYLLACADDTDQVVEVNEANNCRASQGRVQVGSPTTVALTVAIVGPGSVSGPGIACGADCSERYSPGTSVTLTATPSGNAAFTGWTGGGCGATSPCTTVITVAGSITATFAAAAPGDLVVTVVGNPPASAAAGGNLAASETVANVGATTAGASTTRYYVSPDTTRSSAAALLLGNRSVASLGPGAASAGATAVTIPSSLAPGLYYLLACADDLSQASEGNETNNCRAAATPVQITSAPPPPASAADLVVSEMLNPPATAVTGSGFGARDWVLNRGTAAAGLSVTRYYLSLDLVRDPADIQLGGSRSVAGLSAGQTSKGSINVTLPPGTPAGLYYLLACADDTHQVGEANEANNCRTSQTRVQVGSK